MNKKQRPARSARVCYNSGPHGTRHPQVPMKWHPFMKNTSFAAGASALGLALAMAPADAARAAELQVIAGGGIAGPLKELASQFEGASGHKVAIRFATTPELIRMATGGPFDLAVSPRELFKDAGASAQFAPPAPVTIARVGLGVAVRAGAPKPDIGTPEAFKQALLKAQSIATTPSSAAGAQVLRAFDRLGIAEAMKAKTKAQPGPAQIVEAVARGDAELGVFLINTLTAPGLEVVGPLPAAVQQEIIYDAAVAAKSSDAKAAQDFITFLRTPAAAALIKAKGMTPG